jgi:hypothetical protein
LAPSASFSFCHRPAKIHATSYRIGKRPSQTCCYLDFLTKSVTQILYRLFAANERPVIQYKCLVPDLCIPRSETAWPRYFQNRIIMFSLSPYMYLYRSQLHECRNWERGRAVSFLGIFVSNFRYSMLYGP